MNQPITQASEATASTAPAPQEATPQKTSTPKVAAKPVARKPSAKKVAAKKPAAKKVAAKKIAVKKVAAKKPVAQKVATPAPQAPAKAEKRAKPQKLVKAPKVVRDSFTMPASDFAIIDRIKLRAIEWKQPVKKSEVLRAALHALEALSDAKVRALLTGLSPIKKGRPKSA